MNPNPIARLVGSSKALVVLGVTIASFVGLYLGKAQWLEVEGFLKWILITWLGAVGVEDAAKHLANSKIEAAREIAKSTPPPPPRG
jgi:hypothetical protein